MNEEHFLSVFGAPDEANKGEDESYADSASGWVERFLKPYYIAKFDARWCNEWWNHTQATLLFEALWHSWEEARASDMVNAGGQSTLNYYLGHFSPALDKVTGQDGVFANCEDGRCAGQRDFGTSQQASQVAQRSQNLTLHDRVTAMSERVLGQEGAIAALARRLTLVSTGYALHPNRPKGVLLFCGPTGCGKTELARTIAEIEFGTSDALIRLDMGEYGHEGDKTRLIGPPPGYIGVDEPEDWLTTKAVSYTHLTLPTKA